MTENQSSVQDFIAQIERQILRLAPELVTGLVKPGIAVALSGGSDSTALLIAMSRLSQVLSWELCAAHINHGTRGEHSRVDEDFCRQLCARLNIKFKHAQLQLNPPFSEEQLRLARYAELEQIAQQTQSNYLLLGHTLDDQTETMLFNLFRGTGLAGLKGIPPRRSMGSLTLLRPMLNMRHADCGRFLEELKQDWVEDSTNAEDIYTRNYIRHNIIPNIEQRFPGFQEQAAHLRAIIAETEEHLEATAVKVQTEIQTSLAPSNASACEVWNISLFNAQTIAVRKQLIAAALKRYRITLSRERIQDICELFADDTKDGALSLDAKFRVRTQKGYALWEFLDDLSSSTACDYTVVFPGTTLCPAFNKALTIETTTKFEFPQSTATEAVVDLSNVVLPLTIRSRRAGDIIQPFGMEQKVRLKKFIHTHKSSSSLVQHTNLAVLADQDEILWIPGMGISEKIRVKNNSTAYHLSWSDIAPKIAEEASGRRSLLRSPYIKTDIMGVEARF